jgi:hypothetical protein
MFLKYHEIHFHIIHIWYWEHLLCNQPTRAIMQTNRPEPSDPKIVARSKLPCFHLHFSLTFLKTPFRISAVSKRPRLLQQIVLDLIIFTSFLLGFQPPAVTGSNRCPLPRSVHRRCRSGEKSRPDFPFFCTLIASGLLVS